MTRSQFNSRRPGAWTVNSSDVIVAGLACVACWASTVMAEPLGSQMTYQGRITDGGAPVNDTLDFRFQLWDADSGGTFSPPQFVEDVVVTDGLFTVELDFGTGPFNGDARWLAIGVRDGTLTDPAPYTPLSPRQPLTAAPYAQTAVNALSADAVVGIDGHSLNAADNTPPDAVYVDNNGNVGVGTTTPAESFHLSRGAGTPAILVENTTSGAAAYRLANVDQTYDMRITNTEKLVLRDVTAGNVDRLVIDTTGNIGIGTTSPGSPLSFSNTDDKKIAYWEDNNPNNRFYGVGLETGGRVQHWTGTFGSFEVGHFNAVDDTFIQRMRVDGTADGGRMRLYEPGGDQRIMASVNAVDCGDIQLSGPNGNVNVWMTNLAGSPDHGFIGVYDSSGVEQAGMYVESDGDGRIFTGVLQINGGSDLAEPFDVSSEQAIEPGMVVAIDPARTGKLRLSTRAYDHTVAGVISGAGGVNPGLMMSQQGSVADGEHPVALTGRVYCWVDADAGGAVHPGDLLTTSDTPGHAMRVADHGRAAGAILGKSMSSLEKGRGLVLVLVSLQ